MRVRPASEKPNKGRLIVTYSETGVGKSTSCLDTLPLPIMYMCAEARNAELSAESCGRELKRGDFDDVKDYVIAEYTTWEEFLGFMSRSANFDPFNSVVLDGLTQLMINLSIEIEDQAYDALPAEKKRKRLITEAKLSQEGYGALASQMNRAVPLLGKLTQNGKIVVINSLLEATERFDGILQAYPSLMGKRFGEDLPGACDLIALLEHRYDKEGKLVFPPLAKFECGHGEQFQCKWTGRKISLKRDGKPIELMQMPLDFNLILGGA